MFHTPTALFVPSICISTCASRRSVQNSTSTPLPSFSLVLMNIPLPRPEPPHPRQLAPLALVLPLPFPFRPFHQPPALVVSSSSPQGSTKPFRNLTSDTELNSNAAGRRKNARRTRSGGSKSYFSGGNLRLQPPLELGPGHRRRDHRWLPQRREQHLRRRRLLHVDGVPEVGHHPLLRVAYGEGG